MTINDVFNLMAVPAMPTGSLNELYFHGAVGFLSWDPQAPLKSPRIFFHFTQYSLLPVFTVIFPGFPGCPVPPVSNNFPNFPNFLIFPEQNNKMKTTYKIRDEKL